MTLDLRIRRILIGSVFRSVCCGALALGLASLCRAADPPPAAILSSDLTPYQEAFQGLQEVWKQPITPVYLSARNWKLGESMHTIIAFGGEAAMQAYPSDSLLIYCMAPGTHINPASRQGPTIQVSLMPAPQTTLSKIKDIQPSVKRVAVLWTSETYQDYLKDFSQAAAAAGIQIEFDHVKNPSVLPDIIRQLQGRVDAVWLTADPPLINTESLLLLKEFSWSNKIPLYSPIEGLAERGAAASIYTSYRQIGRNAGHALQQGIHQSQTVYPTEVNVTLNAAAADRIGLHLAASVLRDAQKIIQ